MLTTTRFRAVAFGVLALTLAACSETTGPIAGPQFDHQPTHNVCPDDDPDGLDSTQYTKIQPEGSTGAAGTTAAGSFSYGGEDGKTITVDVNIGWKIDICVKSGSQTDFVTNFSATGVSLDPPTQEVFTVGQEISHISWKADWFGCPDGYTEVGEGDARTCEEDTPPGCTEDCVIPDPLPQWCSPGYWRQPHHFGSWVDADGNAIPQSTLFSDVMSGYGVGAGVTLIDVLNNPKKYGRTGAFEAVGDYLSEQNPDVDFTGVRNNEEGQHDCPLGRDVL